MLLAAAAAGAARKDIVLHSSTACSWSTPVLHSVTQCNAVLHSVTQQHRVLSVDPCASSSPASANTACLKEEIHLPSHLYT